MSGNRVWVVGHHAVNAVLSVSPERALSLHCVIEKQNPQQSRLIELASRLGIPLHPVDQRQLSKQCGIEHHQGVALQSKPKQEGNERELEKFVSQTSSRRVPLLLILDQVQDPHNFGACLRTADAAGADAVIVVRDNASPLTAVVHKVASGAAETMPIFRVANLARVMDSLKQQGVWMIGTSDKAAVPLFHQDLTGPLAIIVGAEDRGLRKLTESKCDVIVSLPVAGPVVSSLNVSVATGICLYEVRRQRSYRS